MNRTRQAAIGVGMMIAGVITVVVGGVVASRDLIVGLILLLLVPLSVSFCGVVVALIGVVRHSEGASRSSVIRRIIGVGALAGVGWGFGFPALGILSQLPDYASGLNGAHLPAPALSVFLLPGTGLLVGLGLGALVALIWRTTRGRNVPSAAVAQSPR
jgi:hypothetical protein